MKWYRIRSMLYRYVVTWKRELEELLEVFWWPSFDLLLWGFMTVYLQGKDTPSGHLMGYIIGAIILWMFVYRSQQEISVLFLRECWNQNFLNIFSSPITITEYLVTTILVGLMKLCISAGWMTFLAYIVFHFSLSSLGFSFIPLVINLLLVGWWTGFFVMGLIVQYGYRIQAFAWSLIMIIQPFSGVFYPISILPLWMQKVAVFLPTSYLFETMRQVLSTGTMNIQSLGIATGLNVFYICISLLFFRFSFNRAKEKGMIIKFS